MFEASSLEKKKKSRFKWLPLTDELIEIWDLRNEGKSFKEIAATHGITEGAAQKRFYTAFQLVTGKQYEKFIWKELLREQLEKIALTEKPTDKEFWTHLSKLETVSRIELIPELVEDEDGNQKNFFDSVGKIDEGYSVNLLISDCEKICSNSKE